MAKRNMVKEAKWQKEKYRKFGFTVDKEQGNLFEEVLKKRGITPLKWFKHQMQTIVKDTTVDIATTTIVEKITKRSLWPTQDVFGQMTEEELNQWYTPLNLTFAKVCDYEFDNEEISILIDIFKVDGKELMDRVVDGEGHSKAHSILGSVYAKMKVRRKEEKITHPLGWMEANLRKEVDLEISMMLWSQIN